MSYSFADEPRDAGVDPTPSTGAGTPTPPTDAGSPATPTVSTPVEPPKPESDTKSGKKHGKKHTNDQARPGDTTSTVDEPSTSKRKKKHGELTFAGRLFVRAAAVKEKTAPDVVGQATVPSARVKSEYRWQRLQAEVEVEFANKVRLKNLFAELRLLDDGAKVDVRAGNFKVPFSEIQLSSIWTLPMADRGLLDNVLVNRLQVSGRAVGAMVAVEWPVAWSPELRVGVFQGVDDAGNALVAPARDRFGQDGVVRVTVKPIHGLEIGVAAGARVGELLVIPVVVSRGYQGELDVTLNTRVGPGRLRVWIEGMVGTSWLVADPARKRATFDEARGIAAWRLGGADHGDRYFEIYGLFGVLDPDAAVRNDLVVEATGGVTYGAWNAWRIQAEVERWRTGSNAPIGIVELGLAPPTSTTVLVQLGARI